MKRFLDNFHAFINEQKNYFDSHLANDFIHSWDDDVWYIGTHGTGWLQGTGKGTLQFSFISKTTKGFDSKVTIESNEYKSFMKATLITVYRKRNSISTSVATASLLILKRWYPSLFMLTGQSHPIYLTTTILHDAMERYQNASKLNDPNVADTLGRCVGLQATVNHYAFCLSPLDYKNNIKYTNNSNLTKRAVDAQKLKGMAVLDDSKIENKSKLISISTFINIVALINKCETVGEKILLNLILLLIVTGFRSIEAITLRKDSLVKREIEDLVTRKKFENKGTPLYFLGIKYVGAKGAGERTHWVEPLAIPLVEAIFEAVIELTIPFREKLVYLRNKKFSDYLPKEIDNLSSELIELDDIGLFIVGTLSDHRGRAGRRDKTYKALKKAGINPIKTIQTNSNGGRYAYYSKFDLSLYIASNFRNNKSQIKEPCMLVWQANNKDHKEQYENLLFIHEYRSTNMTRLLVNKANPVPFENNIINKFLGATTSVSAFKKYELKESNGDYSSITSHIPRHNINTFLAIAEISDHLQAMLMGRVDISQNEHYKHLALEQSRKAASILPYESKSSVNEYEITDYIDDEQDSLTPLNTVKITGMLTHSKNLDVEMNLKTNLHTFDDKNDVANFMEASFSDGMFDDIRDAFDELNEQEGPKAASELVHRHAELHPLKLGSCTRNIALWGCPYRIKCQSGGFCSNFTLTGRADELDKIKSIKLSLEDNLYKAERSLLTDSKYKDIIKVIEINMDNINLLEAKAHKALENNGVMNIYDSLADNNSPREVTTLADLFSLEHMNQKGRE